MDNKKSKFLDKVLESHGFLPVWKLIPTTLNTPLESEYLVIRKDLIKENLCQDGAGFQINLFDLDE